MKKAAVAFAFLFVGTALPYAALGQPVASQQDERNLAAQQIGETAASFSEDNPFMGGLRLPGLFDSVGDLLGRLFPSLDTVKNTPSQEIEPQVRYQSLGAFFSKVFTELRMSRGLASTPASSAGKYPEIAEILNLSDTAEQSKIYRKLIERVGPVEAQEALYHSGLPFTGETHLVQHTAGIYLYETEGREGISKCTLYFLAACYHEFIISLLASEGLGALPDVMRECWKFGPSIASQCAHGVGHGLLVWYDYRNLDKAAAGCDALAQESEGFPTINCLDGVFMENQWALHPGATSESQWLSDTDPYYPCNDPRIREEWQTGCWLNQGSIMYQFFKGDIAKTSDACLGVEDPHLRETCFNSLSRQIHPLTKSDYSASVRMCGELDPAWRDYCLETISVADFSVGGRGLSYTICANFAEPRKAECYGKLSGVIRVYARDDTQLESFCAPIRDEAYRRACRSVGQP